MKFLWTLLLLVSITSADAQMNQKRDEYWSLGADKTWSGADLDKAFAVFTRLKDAYGDQFNLVVQDLHKPGAAKADGTKTAQILIKIYVSPPNPSIERELKNVGLVYVK